MNIIEIKNLSFQYTKQDKAIKDITLDIKRGEFVCILGHNGSGKSTLAKLIIGLLEANSGEIYVDSLLLNEENVYEIRKKIGIVFQNPDNQFVGVTVKDDIAFGMENRLFKREAMIEAINKYSKIVDMHNFLDNNPEMLSGGEKQRVAIAGVLAVDPDVIIFDEATSMLDPKGINEVDKIINELKQTKTIIQITHNLKEAVNADRVIVMNDGKIVLSGTPKEVFLEKQILKDCNLDILETMKLIELFEKENKEEYKQIEEILWELTFQK